MNHHETTDQPSPSRAARLRWPMIIVGLLMGHVGAMALALHVARGDADHRNGNRVIPGYYEKAVHWDEGRAALRASDTLGWTVHPVLSVFANGAGQRDLTVMVRDEANEPVVGLQLTASLWHHAVGEDVDVAFQPVVAEPGLYRASAPMVRPGTWECELRDTREGSVFQRPLTLEVPLLGDGR